MRNIMFQIARHSRTGAHTAALNLFETVQTNVADKKSDMFAVYQDYRIASFIIGNRIPANIQRKPSYKVDWLCAHKNYRNDGFEARLLWHFITHAAKKGAASVVLTPDDKKPWEPDYYKFFGFKNMARSDKMVKTL